MAENGELRHAGDAGMRMAMELVKRVAPNRANIIRFLARNLREQSALDSHAMHTLVEMAQAASDPTLTVDEATIVVGRLLNGDGGPVAAPAHNPEPASFTLVNSSDDLVRAIERSLGVTRLRVALVHNLIGSGGEGRTVVSNYVEALSNHHGIPRACIDAFRGLHGLDRLGPPPGHPDYRDEYYSVAPQQIEAWLKDLWQNVPGDGPADRTLYDIARDALDKASAEGPGVAEGAHPQVQSLGERFADAPHPWPASAEDAPAAGLPEPEPVKHTEAVNPLTIVGSYDVGGKVVEFGDGRIMVLVEHLRSNQSWSGYLS